MSLANSISNAFSGLIVTSRAAQYVSSNLANALNENYARQEIEISSSQNGGALLLNSSRIVDRALVADRRNTMAEQNLVSAQTEAAIVFEQAVGFPDEPSSVPAHLNRFDATLRYLESDPGSDVRLRDVLSSAQSLSARLNASESTIQSKRQQADSQIAIAVDRLNTNLDQIVTLNAKIVEANVNGRDTHSLLDQRQKLVDEVSELVPVREMRRSRDAISLVTANGMMLIDSSAKRLEFTKSNLILPHMLVENDDLSTITSGTDDVDLGDSNGPLSGGRLQALFEIRDQSAVHAQDQIDTFALDLASRLHDLPSDTLALPGAPGLFTDASLRATAVDKTGLAGRLSVNTKTDPDAGGELWRIRGGFHEATETSKGDASFISDMISRLAQNHSTNGSSFDVISEITSQAAQNVSSCEQRLSFASAQLDQLTQMHLANGVDTDAELEKLLRIETNYAANAKVLQAVDEMFSEILRIN